MYQPDESVLKNSWQRCWQGLGNADDGLDLMQQLIAAYQQPQRKYHTLQHLTECLTLFENHTDLAEYPAEIEIALWFHDAVYDVYAKDNEAQSAIWAVTALQAAGVKEDVIARVDALILATCHHALPETRDQQLLVDIDLAILGAAAQRFQEYERQIRDEYAWVTEELFQTTRLGILKTFNTRKPIYHTAALYTRLEHQAHQNLMHSITQLSGC